MMFTLLLQLLAVRADTSLPAWIPHRVYDAQHRRFSDFETLAATAAGADVVFLGEQHDNAGTHRIELALLEAVARRRSNVVVSLEMFERDVQPVLDRYLAGTISETEFLAASRPWPRYASDYRPIIEFARSQGWRVVASDVPRPMASRVATRGLDAVSNLADSTREWVARDLQCPTSDDYYRRFKVAMGEHPMGEGAPTVDNMYRAQCVKDETMAESIVAAHRNPSAPLIIQYNGDFHSDFGEGTAARVRRRLPDARVVVISAVPVASLDRLDPKPLRKQGDWLVFVLQSQ
jgi:uncharacterized iron-regulated protein